MGGPQEVFIITVVFPFTGSNELFGYNPNGVSVVSGRVYQPSGSKISVEVQLAELNKEKALSEARGLMEATKSIVEANSKQAADWSKSMDSKVDSLLQQKRHEILNFYS